MKTFVELLTEGTERPSGQPHFWTSILHGTKNDLLGHLDVLKNTYRVAAGGKPESPLPNMSVKWDGSMHMAFGNDGSIGYKYGKPVKSADDLASRKFSPESEHRVRTMLAAHQSESLVHPSSDHVVVHGDVIRTGEPFIRNALRTIKPNSVTYQVGQNEERPNILAVHGISVNGQLLHPTDENMQKYVNTKHSSIATIPAYIDPKKTPTAPTKFPVNQAVRRVDDAIHAVNSFSDEDHAAVQAHANQFQIGSKKGPYLRGWLHGVVYSSHAPSIDSYVDWIQNHPTAVKGNREAAIQHAKENAGPIERFASMLQKVTPATSFVGQAAHYLNPAGEVRPQDLDHEGIVYEHPSGRTHKFVPPNFSRLVIDRSKAPSR